MIDTVCLYFRECDFEVRDFNRFSPSVENLFRPPYLKLTGGKPFKAVNNPTRKDRDEIGYCPRITMYKAVRRGGFQIYLHVEFSAPKLLYGNNFEELSDEHLPDICRKLHETMFHMGIRVIDGVTTIRNAAVKAIHYSKNILLKNYMTPYEVLKELEKMNLSRRLDLSSTTFRNEGHALKCHTSDFEIILYDKVKDLKQATISEKRSIERDYYCQMSIFDLKDLKKAYEVLRIEIRLGTKKKLKNEIKKFGIEDCSFTFAELFNESIAKRILLQYYDHFLSLTEATSINSEATLEQNFLDIIQGNPELSLRKSLSLFGVKLLIDEIGVRRFRELTERYGVGMWRALNKEMQELKRKGSISANLQEVRAQLDTFVRVKKEDLPLEVA